MDFYTKDIQICGLACCSCMFEGLSSIERLWVMLLDTASCLTDSQGQLIADISSDGVHFKKAGYQTWLEYLKCHTISPEEIPQ